MNQGNFVHRLFDIMQEFGEDTDLPWALVHDDIQPDHWNYFRHQDVDGMGLVCLALQHQGVRIEIPRYKGVVPSTGQRFRLAWRKFRSSTPAPVRWRRWQAAPDGVVPRHSQTLRGQLLTEALTQQVLGAAKLNQVTLNTWLLWSLNAAVAPALTLDGGERAWGNTVNMRGQVPALKLTDNQSSIVTVVFNDSDTPTQLHQRIQALFSSGLHWGSWDFLNTVCRLGPNLVRKQIRRYYSSNNSQMGTFSNLGVLNWDVSEGQAPYMFFAPCSTRTAPIAAAAGTLNGRLSLTLGLHPFLQVSPQQIEAIMADWVKHLLAQTPAVSALAPAAVAAV